MKFCPSFDVPQGSNLDSRLFLLFINVFIDIIDCNKLYTDDITVTDSLCLQREIDEIDSCLQNHLNLNVLH